MPKVLPAPAFGYPSALFGRLLPKTVTRKPGQGNKVLLFALGFKKQDTLCLLPYAFESAAHVAAHTLHSRIQ